MTSTLGFEDLSTFLPIVLVNKHADKSRYFIKGYVESNEMGFLSYEYPQVVKHQLDLKGKELQRMAFNIQLNDDNYIRDATLIDGNLAIVTSSKQLILQGPEQNGLQSEIANFYN